MMGLWIHCKLCSVLLFSVIVVCQSMSKDVDTSACYSSSTRCGQHSMLCPLNHTVIVTNARYGHRSRSTPCSRGKVSSCSDRYMSTCCRATRDECYIPYNDEDADSLLQPCLGSRTCFHMTPQINQFCAKYKLSSSTLSVVTHRCVSNEHIIGYNTKDQVINDEIYLQYRIPDRKPKRGTASVYGCDVIEPRGVKVKVKALNVGMVSVNGRQCSSLEIKKDGRISSYSCGRTDLRFRLTLSEEVVPFEVNIVEVFKSPPQTAWTFMSGRNITVECGKIRPSRRVVEPSTQRPDKEGDLPTDGPIKYTSTSSQPTTGQDSNIPQTGSPSTATELIETTEDTHEATSSMPGENVENPGDITTAQESDGESVLPSTPQSTTAAGARDGLAASDASDSDDTRESSSNSDDADRSEASTERVESVPVVGQVAEEDNYRALTYSGIAGGLILLIILIIIITVICYRRKRYRLYQSRKIEEKRNIPDGAERSNEKEETEKDSSSEEKPKGRVSSPSFSSSSSPPRVSQPLDYDGYTDPDKKKGGTGTDNAERNVTVEFFDNPGFKTTIDYIKLGD